jgi:phosphoenolpyruvate carboxylase
MAIFSKNYLYELYEILDYITETSEYVPNQRERILEIGDVAYYRRIRNIKSIFQAYRNSKITAEMLNLSLERFGSLPRAIKLSATLYSMGIPPEFLGLGNGIQEIKQKLGQKWVDQLLDYIYPTIKDDIKFSSQFYYSSIIEPERISKGIKILETFFPFEPPDDRHQILSETALSIIMRSGMIKPPRDKIIEEDILSYLTGNTNSNLSNLILAMGKIRRSLG